MGGTALSHDHGGHRQRMKERFIEQGLEGFAPHEALELLLFYAIPQKDVNPLAHTLIDRFGSFSNVLEAPVSELSTIPGIGPSTAAFITLIPHLARYYARSKAKPKQVLTNVQAAGEFCVSLFHGRANETFILIGLDIGARVIAEIVIASGTIDESTVYPRRVAQAVLNAHAHSVILTHNHPGGTLAPSPDDIETTRQIAVLLSSFDVNVLDHIIVADDHYYSFNQNGLIALSEGSAYSDVPRRGSRRAAERAQAFPMQMKEDPQLSGLLDDLLYDLPDSDSQEP